MRNLMALLYLICAGLVGYNLALGQEPITGRLLHDVQVNWFVIVLILLLLAMGGRSRPRVRGVGPGPKNPPRPPAMHRYHGMSDEEYEETFGELPKQ